MKLHTLDVINSVGDRVGRTTVWSSEEDLADVLAAQYPKLVVVPLPERGHWVLRSRSGTYLGQLRRVREQE